jgi:hypothetical protein
MATDEEITTTTTTEAPVEPTTTTTTTTEAEVTTTTTTELPEEDKGADEILAEQIAPGFQNTVENPANDHVLGDDETSPNATLANARAEAVANHAAEQLLNS